MPFLEPRDVDDGGDAAIVRISGETHRLRPQLVALLLCHALQHGDSLFLDYSKSPLRLAVVLWSARRSHLVIDLQFVHLPLEVPLELSSLV